MANLTSQLILKLIDQVKVGVVELVIGLFDFNDV
jgi:hypothetical protein